MTLVFAMCQQNICRQNTALYTILFVSDTYKNGHKPLRKTISSLEGR